MSTRKRWSTVWDHIAGGRRVHPSKAAAYSWVREQAGMVEGRRSNVVRVYVDEGDGQGWQLYEVVDLREVAANLKRVRTRSETGGR